MEAVSDPPVRALLRGAPRRGAAPSAAAARPRARRGRVPGDVPAGAAAYGRLEHGEHLRAWVLTIAQQRRRRHAAPRTADGGARRDAGDRGRRPAYAELATSPTGSPRRSAPPSCSATATTSPTTRSRPRSARARTRPARPRPPACAACEGGSPHDRLPRSRPPLPRRRRDARPARRRLRRRRLARSARCSSPRPTEGSPRSRSTPTRTAQLERLARDRRAARPPLPAAIDAARRELDEYFEGRAARLRPRARPPRARRRSPSRCSHELARVPYGETTTYGALAARVGHPRAARAVGTVMNRNRIPIVLPCHRVVGATGEPRRLRRRARPQGDAARARGRALQASVALLEQPVPDAPDVDDEAVVRRRRTASSARATRATRACGFARARGSPRPRAAAPPS